MVQNELIDNPQLWFDFLTARNKKSHTYDEYIAREVYTITVSAVEHFEKLLLKISELNK